MKPSKYLKAVQNTLLVGRSMPLITGNLLLVEIPAKEELKSKGGLILTDNSKNQVNGLNGQRTTVVHVLAVGEGYYKASDLEGEEVPVTIPLDTRPGAVLVVSDHSLQMLPHFPGLPIDTETKVALVKETETQIRFNSYEDFCEFEARLAGQFDVSGKTGE